MGSGRKFLWLAGSDQGFGFLYGDRGQCLAELKGLLRNPSFFPPILSCHGRDAPHGPVKENFWGYVFTHSIGRIPSINLFGPPRIMGYTYKDNAL
jgi:hypothetical protein